MEIIAVNVERQLLNFKDTPVTTNIFQQSNAFSQFFPPIRRYRRKISAKISTRVPVSHLRTHTKQSSEHTKNQPMRSRGQVACRKIKQTGCQFSVGEQLQTLRYQLVWNLCISRFLVFSYHLAILDSHIFLGSWMLASSWEFGYVFEE